MHANDMTPEHPDVFLDTLAAELTSAAYPVALRHAVCGTWVDLELELWRVLGDVVRRRQEQLASPIPLHVRRGN